MNADVADEHTECPKCGERFVPSTDKSGLSCVALRVLQFLSRTVESARHSRDGGGANGPWLEHCPRC
jgi:hypothetical protein